MRRLLLVSVLCAPVLAGAQRVPTANDSAAAIAIRVARDSVRCATSPRRDADQCSRARLRLDSIRTALVCPRALSPTIPAGGWFCPAAPTPPPPGPGPIATIEVTDTGPLTTPYYASRTIDGHTGAPVPAIGVDTVTVCAVVTKADSSRKIGWPPVRMLQIGDSAIAGTRGGNPLRQMCAVVDSLVPATDSVPVTWALTWLTYNGVRKLRPIAYPTPP